MAKLATSNKQVFSDMADPVSAMAEFEQLLVSNSGEDAFDCAIRLLAAKLIDELEIMRGRERRFAIQGDAERTYMAVEELYRLAIQRWPEINGTSVDLGLSPAQLTRSIRPLIGWKLVDSDLSLLDATLERLVSKATKGALGQYFTPRDVIRLCIEVLNPTPKDIIIDPACGSGGFLMEATRYSVAHYGKYPKCLGIDFGAKAVKVAALMSAASPQTSITVSKANSLDGRRYSHSAPTEWRDFLSNSVGSKTEKAKSWGDWNRLGCNMLVTNPPFAGDIDELDVIAAYECTRRMGTKKSLSREHLFLERSVEMLNPNGRLAIILPQGILANASAAFLRQWLFERCRILGVIGLHPFAFMPYTSVKTSIIFIEKLPPGHIAPKDSKVFFAVSTASGKDSSGRNTGTTDYQELSKAFRRFLQSEQIAWVSSQDTDGLNQNNIISDVVPFSEVLEAGRLDAEFFDPKGRATNKVLSHHAEHTLGEIVEPRLTRFKRQLFGDITYFDISCVDQRTGISFPEKILSEQAPSRASHIVSGGDVLVSTVRPERNVVGLVPEELESTGVASSGFCVLRPKSVAPELLFAYCKTDVFRELLSRRATASMYPAVTDRDVLNIPFVQPPDDISEKVIELIDSAFDLINQAHKRMEEAISLMNEHLRKPYTEQRIQGKTRREKK